MHRAGKRLAQGHTAIQGQGWDLNLNLSDTAEPRVSCTLSQGLNTTGWV